VNLLGGKTGGRFPVKNPPTYMWCSPYSWDLARTTRTWILMRPSYTISSHARDPLGCTDCGSQLARRHPCFDCQHLQFFLYR
jgi:hypothetical protein